MRSRFKRTSITLVLLATLKPDYVQAETGYEAWLRYARLNPAVAAQYDHLPGTLVVLGDSPILSAAREELVRGVKGTLGRTLRIEPQMAREGAIVLGTLASIKAASLSIEPPRKARGNKLQDDAYRLTSAHFHGFKCMVITGATERAVLYGVFALLRKIALGESVAAIDEEQSPQAPIRWVNEWDNLDGTIERGYGGRSIFFEDGHARADLSRVRDYGRLLASLGINGCAINNVNANPRVLQDDFLPQLARIADVLRPFGVRLAIAVDVSSPRAVGGLETFDPIDSGVAEWWRAKVGQIYGRIPDFGGFVVKADSEGRAGPSSYGRTPADAANVIARALKPHGGVLFYRTFVYNHHLDWRDPKNDRARAAYDVFHPLDGQFEENVILQIKHGPIDFQVREPVSPLFGGLPKSNLAIELQITQEYTGQQRHVCFLPPMWKEVLDFDMHAGTDNTLVKEIVAGRTFHRPTGGFVGVANVGSDQNWLGSLLAMANLYGFGRLAWDPDLSAKTIVQEWTKLTFGDDSRIVATLSSIQLDSWHTYENYTGPLGVGTLTNILGSHYGPGIESSEGNGWGQWHRGDHQGIGMDRSVSTGTGFVGSYWPPVQRLYEGLATCPDELLLFFHHVPYNYVLHSGKTVIQHVYDSHYQGAQEAEDFVDRWKALKGLIDPERYAEVLGQLEYQSGHARVWRDAVCEWFLRMSGIPDAKGRVGHYPNRREAEEMKLQGYEPIGVVPIENASGGKAIECPPAQTMCAASFNFAGSSGTYEVDLQYFDQNNGASQFRVFIREHLVDEWIASMTLPASKIGGDSSTWRRIRGLALRPGDEIRIEGIPDRDERAAIDYVEIRPEQ